MSLLQVLILRRVKICMDIINELNKSNMTIIMISHDIKVALEYATKVLYIGEHIFFGTTPEYKKSRGMA